jgi:hypothetical protein
MMRLPFFTLYALAVSILFYATLTSAIIQVNVVSPSADTIAGNKLTVTFNWSDSDENASSRYFDLYLFGRDDGNWMLLRNASLSGENNYDPDNNVQTPNTYSTTLVLSDLNMTDLNSGYYHLAIYLYNSNNAIADANSELFYLDLVPPVAWAVPESQTWKKDSQIVALQCADNLVDCARIHFKLGNNDWQIADTNYFTISVLSNGENELYIRAEDSVGNLSDVNSFFIYVDSGLPQILNVSPPNNGYVASIVPRIYFEIVDWESGVDIETLVMTLSVKESLASNTLKFPFDYNLLSPFITPIENGYALEFDFNTLDYNLNVLEDASFSITVDVNDNVGNSRIYSSAFFVDFTPPTNVSIVSDFDVSYTRDPTPEFRLHAEDSKSGMSNGAMRFSCTGAQWTDEVPYVERYAGFDITRGPGCTSADGNKHVYVQFRDAAGNWSSAASTTVLYDGNKPKTPEIVRVEKGFLKAKVEWNAVEDVGPAGVEAYIVYKDGVPQGVTDKTSFVVEDLNIGKTYTVTVRAIDAAGNYSDFSDPVQVQSLNPPEIEVAIALKDANGNSGQVFGSSGVVVEVTFSERVDNAYLYVTLPESSETTLIGPKNGVDMITYTLSLKGVKSGSAFLRVSAVDFYGRTVEHTASFTVDAEPPLLTWLNPTQGSTINGDVLLKVKAVDAESSVARVLFFIDDEFLGEQTKPGTADVTYWLYSADYRNGIHTLKAIAIDVLGNAVEASIDVNIFNAERIEQTVVDELAVLDTMHSTAGEKFEKAKQLGVVLSARWKYLLNDADNARALAKKAFVEKRFNDALSLAKQAQTLYSKLDNNFHIAEHLKMPFVFGEARTREALEGLDVSQDIKDETIKMSKNNIVTRTFYIVELKEDNNTYYVLTVVITFESLQHYDFVQVVEIIPKEFANYASELVSDHNFEVIRNEPVIRFYAEDVNAGSKLTFSYSLKKTFDEVALGALLKSRPWKSYTYPPLFFSRKSNPGNVIVLAMERSKKLPKKFFDFVILGVAVIVVALLIVLVSVGLSEHRARKKRRPSPYKPESVVKPKLEDVEDYRRQRIHQIKDTIVKMKQK